MSDLPEQKEIISFYVTGQPEHKEIINFYVKKVNSGGLASSYKSTPLHDPSEITTSILTNYIFQ